MICKNCNQEIPEDSQFCSYCGNHLSVLTSDANQEKGDSFSSGVLKQLKDPSPNKRVTKRIIIILIPILIFLSVGLIILFQKPFSNDTNAIARASESVVLINCYDYSHDLCATGSGFIAYDSQTVITNYHVISEAYRATILTEQDRTYSIESIICYSKEKDIAIIKLSDETDIKPLTLGDSDKINKGENVVAIGSPFGLKNSVSMGVLSGRLMDSGMDVLQFSASISEGSSGGALFDNSGKVIGVTYASYTDGQNLNFAVPINEVKNLHSNTNSLYSLEELYIENYPYAWFLDLHKNNIYEVSLSDLKNNPTYYQDKLIRLQAYISSNELGLYISDKNSITADSKNDYEIFYNTDFENHPFVKINSQNEAVYIENNLSFGDSIIVIGLFSYSEDTLKTVGLAPTGRLKYGSFSIEYTGHSSGMIQAKIITKTES